MAIMSPLFVASVASLTLAMTTIGATINLLQQKKILPCLSTSSSCNSTRQDWGPLPQSGNYNHEEYMYLFLWMEDQKLMGNDPLLALVAEDNKVETLKDAVKAQEKIEAKDRGAFFAWRAPILSWPRIVCSQVRMLIFLEPPREMP